MKAGDILRHDGQADVYRGRYQLIEKVAGERNTWVCETLPDDDEIIEAIFDFWAGQEAAGATTSPIWDKTWAECDEDAGEHPRRIGWKSCDQMLTEELAWRESFYGHRSKVTFVSRARYAEYF